MDSCNLYIGIIEPSVIIADGLSDILLKEDIHYNIIKFESLRELNTYKNKYNLKILLISPSIAVSNIKDFKSVKSELTDIVWIGIIYSLYDKNTLDLFDDLIHIRDSKNQILKIIKKSKKCECSTPSSDENEIISEREKEVLIELVNGLSNKEIADKLNISIHTVISHRKNITEKTSIKSLAGLTIYAITNNIVSIDDVS